MPPPETVEVDPTASPPAELVAYDFAQSSRMAGESLRALTAMHDVLADGLKDWLTAKLRESVNVEPTSVEEVTFGKVVRGLERPSCVYLYGIDGPGQLTAMFLVDTGVAFGGVDRLLGGTAAPAAPDRALTELEQRVCRLIVERLREGVEEMWSEHAEFRMTFSAFESIPDLLDFAEPNDPLLVSGFLIETDGWKGSIHVHLPFALLESALAARSGDDGVDPATPSPAQERQALEGHLLHASVTVDARLPAFTVPLGELKELQPGTVLNTRIPTSSPVHVSVCGQTRFTATAGRRGQELAIRILELASGGSR